ncbi:hypothetical protein Zmor_009770 [Zophobas morio]|uniref:Uncharacterized protein n=1 Tax=Zophobas morio TaxID=2755281 RepID=A0AA38IPN2_9CUCU|nr:hypothetical protein Zmor_009770 [Zophobas morio]
MLPFLSCLKKWDQPALPPTIVKQELLKSISDTFLPFQSIHVYEIIPKEKQAEDEPCGWVVKCRHNFESEDYEEVGLQQYAYGLLNKYKPHNTKNFEVVVLDANRFNVTYTLECGC